MPRDLAGLPWPQQHTLAGGGHSMGGKQTWAGPLAIGDRNLPLRTQRKERKGLKIQSCGLESLAWRATPGHITHVPYFRPSHLSSLQPPFEPQVFGGLTCTAWPTASTWKSWPALVS